LIRHDQIDFGHRQEINGVFLTAVDFPMPVLPAKSFHLADGHLINANYFQGVLHLVQFGKWNCGFYLFHDQPLAVAMPCGNRSGPITLYRLIHQGFLAIMPNWGGQMFPSSLLIITQPKKFSPAQEVGDVTIRRLCH
jgi:hypothetical protein